MIQFRYVMPGVWCTDEPQKDELTTISLEMCDKIIKEAYKDGSPTEERRTSQKPATGQEV